MNSARRVIRTATFEECKWRDGAGVPLGLAYCVLSCQVAMYGTSHRKASFSQSNYIGAFCACEYWCSVQEWLWGDFRWLLGWLLVMGAPNSTQWGDLWCLGWEGYSARKPRLGREYFVSWSIQTWGLSSCSSCHLNAKVGTSREKPGAGELSAGAAARWLLIRFFLVMGIRLGSGMAFTQWQKLQLPPYSFLANKQNLQSDSIRNSLKAPSHSKPSGTIWNSAFGFHSGCLVLLDSCSIARFDSGWLQGVLGPGDVNYQRTQHRAILNQGCSGPEPPWGLKGAEWGTNLNNNRGRGEKHFAATAIVLEQAL